MKTFEIAALVGGELIGDPDVEISSVADMALARSGQLAFTEYADVQTNASCLIAPTGVEIMSLPAVIHVNDPKLAFAKAAAVVHPPKWRSAEIHSSAVIAPSASLGKDVFIGAFTCVGKNSIIGDGCQLRAGSKVGDNVTIGRNCVLHPNVFVE